MKDINILLCCGAGMSSGFLAQKARQSAKKRNISASIDARAESEVGQYLSTIDILMVGPHYGNRVKEFEQLCAPYNIPSIIIPQEIYASLDGEALLDLALDKIEK